MIILGKESKTKNPEDIFPNNKSDLNQDEFNAILSTMRKEENRKKGWNDQIEMYLKWRWFKELLHWQNMAWKHYWYFFSFSTLALILSAITTAFSGINISNRLNETTSLNAATSELSNVGVCFLDKIPWIIFISSLIVTISVGLLKLFRFQEVRERKATYAELLRIEGFKFLQLAGEDYKGIDKYDEAFPIFVGKVENMIKEAMEGYIKIYDKSKNE